MLASGSMDGSLGFWRLPLARLQAEGQICSGTLAPLATAYLLEDCIKDGTRENLGGNPKILGKSWESWKSWEIHGEIYGKSWENLGNLWKKLGNPGGNPWGIYDKCGKIIGNPWEKLGEAPGKKTEIGKTCWKKIRENWKFGEELWGSTMNGFKLPENCETMWKSWGNLFFWSIVGHDVKFQAVLRFERPVFVKDGVFKLPVVQHKAVVEVSE